MIMNVRIDTNQWLKCERCGHDIVPDEPKVIVGGDGLFYAFHRKCYRVRRAEIERLKAEAGME
jgi:ribosomal protein L24E